MPGVRRVTFILFLAALGTTLAAVGGWRYARASAPVSGSVAGRVLVGVGLIGAEGDDDVE